jgi:hypothetical protein
MSYSPCPVLTRKFQENSAHSHDLTVSKFDIVKTWIREIETRVVCVLEFSLDREKFCDEYVQENLKRLVIRRRRLQNYLDKARIANQDDLYAQY